MRLQGEIALVTGSTAGIGRAIATEFAAQGAHVMVTGRDEARGNAVLEKITDAYGTAAFTAADLSEESRCEELVDATLARFGSLTVLVNSAVASAVDDGDHAVGGLATSSWEATLRINLTAPMWLCRAALRPMVTAGHGSIVNISSRAAERASQGLAAYIASKGGLNALHALDRGRLRLARRALQHDQSRLRAQRPPRRGSLRGALPRAGSHAPHAIG